MPIREIIRDGQITTTDRPDDIDFEITDPVLTVGPNVSQVPMGNAVQPTRSFYASRFINQAQTLAQPEAPWVQTRWRSDNPDWSVDDELGKYAGGVRADRGGKILEVTDNMLRWKTEDGEERKIPLARHLPFNRYSGLTQIANVKAGDVVKAGQPLVRSNYTDQNGSLAMGLNARIGLMAYKGHSMDDATVISSELAKRLTSHHIQTIDQDFSSGDLKSGQDHFVSLFPEAFTKDQLSTLSPEGVVKPGTQVRKGDPLILATRPKAITSSQIALGKLSRTAREMRSNASTVWEHESPGTITDVRQNRDGTVKVVVESLRPAEKGDKLALRSGQKMIVSEIVVLPESQMPRTPDGKPLEMLLNHLGIPSRANPALPLELLMGKIAAKRGKPVRLPWFNKNRESWLDQVQAELDKEGLTDAEPIYDPVRNRMLENPVTTGMGYVLKLHHIAENKVSHRGTGAYDADQQPSRGGGAGGGAKRQSGLETVAVLSSGGVNLLREGITLRGQKDDEFWRALRSGDTLKRPGRPFVFEKFKALLNGAGLHARELANGKTRLGLMTDKVLSQYKPLRLRNGNTINFRTLEPEPGGLFDPSLVSQNAWAEIPLDEPLPNPAAAPVIRTLLQLTGKEFESILSGRSHFS